MELITIKIFNTEVEAELFRVFLEANGVEGFVFGNVLANTYNIFNTTSGGVQLKVNEIDLNRAEELLLEFYDEK